jgi:aminodeoxyfutalosine deaminase
VILPATNEDDLTRVYEFTDFSHFIDLWMMTTHAIRTEVDFRQVVSSYAAEAAAHGAVYVEGIFTPAERVSGGASWDEVFTGFCDGAAEAEAAHGVTVRLTPDISRGFGVGAALETVRYAIKYRDRDRGVVGVGLGGRELEFPAEPFADAFRIAKDSGLASVPNAGEATGVESIRGALDALGADRLRHGIRAVEDAGLLPELADRA